MTAAVWSPEVKDPRGSLKKLPALLEQSEHPPVVTIEVPRVDLPRPFSDAGK
jgi:hypothetical protein